MTNSTLAWQTAVPAADPAEMAGNSSATEHTEAVEPYTDALEVDPAGLGQEMAPDLGADPHLCLYRDRTLALLRRYLRMAVEVGRLPSLLGREFFRTRVTSYHTQTFEDSVIFVYDVERCLEDLNEGDKKLLAMTVLQEYSHDEVADLLRCTRRTIVRQYLEILDRISEIFLKREILTPLPDSRTVSAESCQEGEIDEFPASDSG